MSRRHRFLPIVGRTSALHPVEVAARALRDAEPARLSEQAREVARQAKAAQEGQEAGAAPPEPEPEVSV
ncbi:MAG: hypothetical protein ACREFT_09860 [Acetobacteraceae bacterium]